MYIEVVPIIAPVAPPPQLFNNVVITLTSEEAKKLRRVCYFNVTVADKEARSDRGTPIRGQHLQSFLSNLGNMLRDNGINRF